VFGVYSNKHRTCLELGELLALVPDGPPPTSPRPVRQRRRSKVTDEEIAAAYARGATLAGLATRYSLNRRTMAAVVTKAGVPLRYRLIGSRDLMQAITWQVSGLGG
jgi:hypothetical protein